MSNQDHKISDAAKQYSLDLLDRASQDSLSDLFMSPPSQTLYLHPDRNGLSTIAVPTNALTTEQLIKLQKYRLAQYIGIGFVDAQAAYERGMEYEPLEFIGPEDVHVITVSSATGEILCYASFWSLPDPQAVPPDVTLLARERPLFPVEDNFGWGIYNNLEILPLLPINGILELKRYVKNQRLNMLDELSIRAPIEIGVAVFRTISGPLRARVDALVGSIEENVVKRNFDFFHIPLVMIHGAMPIAEETDYLLPHFRDTESYPFAILVSDVSGPVLTHLQQIEHVLEQPGKRGLMALLQLKNEPSTVKCSLIPPHGLNALDSVAIPQKDISMPERRQMLRLGNQLRKFDLFQGLPVAEATILRSLMETVEAALGEVIVRQGEAGDAVYMIENGRVNILVHRTGGDVIQVDQLGPGEYFGEIGLLSGGSRTADVVAETPVKLLKLTRETFIRYLAEGSEVEHQMAAVAARRIVNTGRKIALTGSK